MLDLKELRKELTASEAVEWQSQLWEERRLKREQTRVVRLLEQAENELGDLCKDLRYSSRVKNCRERVHDGKKIIGFCDLPGHLCPVCGPRRFFKKWRPDEEWLPYTCCHFLVRATRCSQGPDDDGFVSEVRRRFRPYVQQLPAARSVLYLPWDGAHFDAVFVLTVPEGETPLASDEWEVERFGGVGQYPVSRYLTAALEYERQSYTCGAVFSAALRMLHGKHRRVAHGDWYELAKTANQGTRTRHGLHERGR